MTFKAMKIKIESGEHSHKVQKALFDQDYTWQSGDTSPLYTGQVDFAHHIYTTDAGKIGRQYGAQTIQDAYFQDSAKTEHFLIDGEFVTGMPIRFMLEPVERPPLGLKPRNIHDRMRMLEVLEAMHRYVKADMKIPLEWHHEYIDFTKKFVD